MGHVFSVKLRTCASLPLLLFLARATPVFHALLLRIGRGERERDRQTITGFVFSVTGRSLKTARASEH